MMHDNRVWCVVPIASAEELANKLTQCSWCCCCGFELGDYLWLNDATSGDGAQEYAVVRKPTGDDPHYRQVESITASWCAERQLLDYIMSIYGKAAPPPIDSGPVVVARSSGDLIAALDLTASMNIIVNPSIESPAEHGRCPHCA